MSIRRLKIPLLATMLICASVPVSADQEKYIQRTEPLPDSLKQLLSTKVDEARILRNWKGLKKGMLFKEVELLLGRPTKIASSAYDHSTTWYYGKYAVIFDNVHKTVRYWEKVE